MPTRFKIRSRGACANGAAESAVIRESSYQRAVPDCTQVKKETPAGFNGTHDWIGEIKEAWSRGPSSTLDLARVVSVARSRLAWSSEERELAERELTRLLELIRGEAGDGSEREVSDGGTAQRPAQSTFTTGRTMTLCSPQPSETR